MNSALVWFFVVNGLTPSPFQPSWLGPFDEQQCVKLRDTGVIPGECKRAVGAHMCEIPGKPWMGIVCPIFEGETLGTGTLK